MRFTKTPTQAESQQHSLYQAACGTGLHVNANKTEYMCFTQKGNTFTPSCSLKLVSSPNNDINMHRAKSWTAINRFSIILKSEVSNKIKLNCFQAALGSIIQRGYTTWTLTKRMGTMQDGNYTRMLRAILKNPGSDFLQNSRCTATYILSLKPSK